MANQPLDFKTEADRLVLVARLVSEIDLNFLLSEVNRAHTLGPIFDPTAYRDALNSGHLNSIAALAQAGIQLSQEFNRVKAKLFLEGELTHGL